MPCSVAFHFFMEKLILLTDLAPYVCLLFVPKETKTAVRLSSGLCPTKPPSVR